MQGIENIFEIKDWQLKIILFIYRLRYQNLRVTTNWKSTIGTHIKKNKELKKKKNLPKLGNKSQEDKTGNEEKRHIKQINNI